MLFVSQALVYLLPHNRLNWFSRSLQTIKSSFIKWSDFVISHQIMLIAATTAPVALIAEKSLYPQSRRVLLNKCCIQCWFLIQLLRCSSVSCSHRCLFAFTVGLAILHCIYAHIRIHTTLWLQFLYSCIPNIYLGVSLVLLFTKLKSYLVH